jgi:hypothetical protein
VGQRPVSAKSFARLAATFHSKKHNRNVVRPSLLSKDPQRSLRMKESKDPEQQDDRKRNTDQPEQKSLTHCTPPFSLPQGLLRSCRAGSESKG